MTNRWYLFIVKISFVLQEQASSQSSTKSQLVWLKFKLGTNFYMQKEHESWINKLLVISVAPRTVILIQTLNFKLSGIMYLINDTF